MSSSDVLLFVVATTLVAIIATLFAFHITAAKFERRMNRRSRTLEGPVPGRRALSTIGLNTESARNTPRPATPHTRQTAVSMEPSTDFMQELNPALSMPSFAKEAKLSSLQTIQSRSASLQTDPQSNQSTGPKPLTKAGAPPVQRLHKRPELEQEQGPAAPHGKSRTQKAGGSNAVSPSSEPTAETAEPTITPKSPASKRAKRANAQAERASLDTSADLPSLDLLATLQPGDIGGSLGQDASLPDIFAGLKEADAGIQGLTDDLTDIDGGGLPAAAPKPPQKSRR